MTWMQLYLLLESSVKTEHSSLVNTPQRRVTAIVGGAEYYLDIFESLTNGELVFVEDFTGEEE